MNTTDLIHAKVHGLRMIPKYKPSQFEQDINKLIAEEYAEECSECAAKLKLLEAKEKLNLLQPQQQKSFLGGLFQ